MSTDKYNVQLFHNMMILKSYLQKQYTQLGSQNKFVSCEPLPKVLVMDLFEHHISAHVNKGVDVEHVRNF